MCPAAPLPVGSATYCVLFQAAGEANNIAVPVQVHGEGAQGRRWLALAPGCLAAWPAALMSDERRRRSGRVVLAAPLASQSGQKGEQAPQGEVLQLFAAASGHPFSLARSASSKLRAPDGLMPCLSISSLGFRSPSLRHCSYACHAMPWSSFSNRTIRLCFTASCSVCPFCPVHCECECECS